MLITNFMTQPKKTMKVLLNRKNVIRMIVLSIGLIIVLSTSSIAHAQWHQVKNAYPILLDKPLTIKSLPDQFDIGSEMSITLLSKSQEGIFRNVLQVNKNNNKKSIDLKDKKLKVVQGNEVKMLLNVDEKSLVKFDAETIIIESTEILLIPISVNEFILTGGGKTGGTILKRTSDKGILLIKGFAFLIQGADVTSQEDKESIPFESISGAQVVITESNGLYFGILKL
jgi:hypothetical protein